MGLRVDIRSVGVTRARLLNEDQSCKTEHIRVVPYLLAVNEVSTTSQLMGAENLSARIKRLADGTLGIELEGNLLICDPTEEELRAIAAAAEDPADDCSLSFWLFDGERELAFEIDAPAEISIVGFDDEYFED